MKKLIALFLFIVTLSVRTEAQPEQNKVIDGVIAVVADEIILRSDLENKMTQYRQSGNPVNENTKCTVMEDLMYNKLLLDQAKIDSIEVQESQVNSELTRRIDYFVQQIGSVEKLEEFYGKSIAKIKDEFYDLIKDQMTIQQMQQQLSKDVQVTPKDVREFYNSIDPDSLPYINAQVEVSHIVIDPQINEEEKESTRQKLRELRERVMDGEDFGTLAYLYSEDQGSAEKNGELGFMKRGMLVPEFAAAAFSLEPSEVSGIVETKFGFHLIKVIEKKGQQVNARHILLKPKVSGSDLTRAKAKLDSIRNIITENESISFADMAEKVSTDEKSSKNGGKIINESSGSARFEMNQMSEVDPNLFFVLDKMEPGEISKPVVYNKKDGSKAYRIVRLDTVYEPHRANLEDDYQRIQSVTKAQKQKELIDEWIQGKIKSTYIKINEQYRECSFEHSWL
jgi:peptidyl-prolyl cis-trans isomerase SurA